MIIFPAVFQFSISILEVTEQIKRTHFPNDEKVALQGKIIP